MPKFRKPVVPVGTHTAPQGSFSVTPGRARSWVRKFKAMLSEGIKVPLGWSHLKDLNPLEPESDAEKAFRASRFNAGYITDLEYDPNAKNAKGELEPALVSVLDIPGATGSDDKGNILFTAELPDGRKVPGAIGEVSGAFDNWQDGKGRTWQDSLMHIALTPLPVAAGQAGFQPVNDPPPPSQVRLSLSTLTRSTLATGETTMADTLDTATPPATPPEPPKMDAKKEMMDRIKQCLADTFGVKVPDASGEDGPEEFLQDLDVALQAAEHAKKRMTPEETSMSTATPPVTEESHAVTMSTLASKSNDPLLKALVLEKEGAARGDLLVRIRKLRKRGGISQKQADEFEKGLTRVQLSILPDGRVLPTHLDVMLTALEEACDEMTKSGLSSALTSRRTLSNFAHEEAHSTQFGELTDAQAEEHANRLAGRLGPKVTQHKVDKAPTKPGTNGAAH